MLAFSLSFPAFSLNCVILLSQPILETQLKIQAASECAETIDWLKIMLCAGSIPHAINVATVSLIFFFNSFGSCLTVIA